MNCGHHVGKPSVVPIAIQRFELSRNSHSPRLWLGPESQ